MRTAHVQALSLETAGRINEAAQLLLAAVGAREAIAVYQRAGQWLEALALARAQLTENDVLIPELRNGYLASLQSKKLPHQTARWYTFATLSLGLNRILMSDAVPS